MMRPARSVTTARRRDGATRYLPHWNPRKSTGPVLGRWRGATNCTALSRLRALPMKHRSKAALGLVAADGA